MSSRSALTAYAQGRDDGRAEAAAEIASLRAALAQKEAALREAEKALERTEHQWVQWEARATAAEAREAELRKAPEPFNRAAFDLTDSVPDDCPLVNVRGESPITAGHFRALRAFLTASKEASNA